MDVPSPLTVVVLILAGVNVISGRKNVHHMEIDNSWLGSKLKVTDNDDFQYGNCRPTDPFQVTDMSMSPVKSEQPVTISISLLLKEDMTDPIQGKLQILEQVGKEWMDLCPTLQQIAGFNCDLGNICEKLTHINCPKVILDQKWNCRCPMKAGSYKIDKYTSKQIPSIPIAGVFNVSLSLKHNEKEMGCAWIKFKLE